MKGRWEIRRRLIPTDLADEYRNQRGTRFTSKDRASRELQHAVPRRDWDLWDRQEGTWAE